MKTTFEAKGEFLPMKPVAPKPGDQVAFSGYAWNPEGGNYPITLRGVLNDDLTIRVTSIQREKEPEALSGRSLVSMTIPQRDRV